jgi:hypothetical protein
MRARHKEDVARLADYVERVFAESQKTRWPTVAEAARALRWRQSRVEEACDSDPENLLFLSSYFVTPEPRLGEHFVERLEDERPKLTIVRGVGGLSVYLCDHRIAGDKPWGGGQVVEEFRVNLRDVEKAMSGARKKAV